MKCLYNKPYKRIILGFTGLIGAYLLVKVMFGYYDVETVNLLAGIFAGASSIYLMFADKIIE